MFTHPFDQPCRALFDRPFFIEVVAKRRPFFMPDKEQHGGA